jgi:acyl-[acyl carrier protein]--UDP-N-acetylglucosamine O-acyltransferase
MIVEGHPGVVRGVNRTGLKRRGFGEGPLEALKVAYKLLFSDTKPLITQAVELEKQYPGQAEIGELLGFMRASMRGKYGRARENLRGRMPEVAEKNGEEEETPHATGN